MTLLEACAGTLPRMPRHTVHQMIDYHGTFLDLLLAILTVLYTENCTGNNRYSVKPQALQLSFCGDNLLEVSTDQVCVVIG